MIFFAGRYAFDALKLILRFRFRLFRFVWVGFVPKPPDDNDDDDASLLSTELLGEAERVRCILDGIPQSLALKAIASSSAKITTRNERNISSAFNLPHLRRQVTAQLADHVDAVHASCNSLVFRLARQSSANTDDGKSILCERSVNLPC